MTTVTPSEPKPSFLQSVKRVLTAREEKTYINPYLGGILLGIVLFGAFFLTGSGLGASGGINRIIVFFQDLVFPNHIDRTPYLLAMAGGKMVSPTS